MSMSTAPLVEREVRGTAQRHLPVRREAQPVSADPTPLALISMGLAVVAFGAVKSGWMNADAEPGILVFALLVGGLLPLIAGLLAFQRERGIEGTVYSGIGALWIGYYLMKTSVLPQISGLGTGRTSFEGFYFLIFAAFTAYSVVVAYRLNWLLITSLALMTLTFLAEAIGVWAPSVGWTQFAGWVGLMTGVVAFVGALALAAPKLFSMPETPEQG